MARKLFIGLAALAVAAAGTVAVAVTHDVPRTVPPEQAAAARDLLGPERPEKRPESFADEVRFVLDVQDRVLSAAPLDKEIPEGQPRELTDLIRAGHGLCFDRSRAIETILRSNGFDVRHVAIYSKKKTGSAIRSLATPQVASHAVTEVLTSRGWMLVDSNDRWIGLTANGAPVSIDEVADQDWHSAVRDPLPSIYREPITWVYGLYSRHGRFYPPYNVIPDVNWAEFLHNI